MAKTKKNETETVETVVHENPIQEKPVLTLLTGLPKNNYEVEVLKKIFPNQPRMWSVAQYWPENNVYVDYLVHECDKDIFELKKKVMDNHDLLYRIIK